MNERREVSLLIAFVDLTRFAAQSQRVDDRTLAGAMDEYYEHVAEVAQRAGGNVVKFIGDAALIVFPESCIDRGVEALLSLKSLVDGMMEKRGWECRLTVQVNFGTVIAGPFGAKDEKRYDVIGKAVNATAMMDATGVTLSAEAFVRLGPELRSRFKEQSPPLTYIRIEDPERFRWTSRI